MKMSKLIVQSAIAALSLALMSSTAFAAGEVKLLKVNSIHTTYKNSYHRGRFEAIVANLAYAKQVSIYMKKSDGTWADFPLAYNRAATAGNEVWAADFANNLPSYADPLEFAVKYQVNGQTYWDNNNGANYKIARNGGTILVNTNVYGNYRAEDYASNVYYGVVTVKNLAPTKDIKVHYSTDGWQTTKVANATFNPYYWNNAYSSVTNPNSYGFEEWQFQLDVGVAPQVEYAIRYNVNGQTYWDNNFGRNYVTRLLR